jgi:hypothetical protein
MNTKKFLSIIAISLSIFFSMESCNKLADIAEDQQISEDNAIAEQASEDVKNITDQSDVDAKLGSLKADDAGSILSDSVIVIKTANSVTIDFGNGYTGKNGRVYKGKIIKTINGKKYMDAGYIASVTFNNFSVNDNKITGQKTIENKGLNTSNQMYWSISSSITVTKTDGKTILWTSTRTRTMTAGTSTPQWADDVYEIAGSASGTASNGLTFELNITTPLVKSMACRYISKGVLTITKTSRSTKSKTVDYGNGDCDATATLTVDGQTKTIILK